MDLDWQAESIEQLEYYWENMLRPRLDGLTDDEYLWEPVTGAWSVRAGPDGVATIDWAMPPPEPAPFTTIAWRLCHVAGFVLALRVSSHFGDGSWNPAEVTWPTTADAALAELDRAYTAWRDGLKGLPPERFAEPAGEAEGPYARHPFATLVLHINREVMHHGGELGTLRDLYRGTVAQGAPVRPPSG